MNKLPCLSNPTIVYVLPGVNSGTATFEVGLMSRFMEDERLKFAPRSSHTFKSRISHCVRQLPENSEWRDLNVQQVVKHSVERKSQRITARKTFGGIVNLLVILKVVAERSKEWHWNA